MKNKRSAELLYLILAGVFIAALVCCNLIFLKFTSFQPFTFLDFGASENSTWFNLTHFTMIISVGLLPYPITFLVTDLISEIYGVRRANNVVKVGLIASLFVLLIVYTANAVPAITDSPVDDAIFTQVFGLAGLSVFASMTAYLIAQFIDIRIFHFWKNKTKGKKLWLRNNFSTIPSQFIDTMTVLLLLCGFGAIEWSNFWPFFLSGFIYKILIALLDTPLFYLFSGIARKHLGLAMGEEWQDNEAFHNF